MIHHSCWSVGRYLTFLQYWHYETLNRFLISMIPLHGRFHNTTLGPSQMGFLCHLVLEEDHGYQHGFRVQWPRESSIPLLVLLAHQSWPRNTRPGFPIYGSVKLDVTISCYFSTNNTVAWGIHTGRLSKIVVFVILSPSKTLGPLMDSPSNAATTRHQ